MESLGHTLPLPRVRCFAQVSPTFHFDLDRISFGVVSYGFLNSKTLTLTNTSEAAGSPWHFFWNGAKEVRCRRCDVGGAKEVLLSKRTQKNE